LCIGVITENAYGTNRYNFVSILKETNERGQSFELVSKSRLLKESLKNLNNVDKPVIF